jgi:hypothetical protein
MVDLPVLTNSYALSAVKVAVKFLTLLVLVNLAGCSLIHNRYGESCNLRAYVQASLPDYLSSRYNSGSQVRLAIIPFSVRANVTAQSNELPGVESELTALFHAELLRKNLVPIVEVLNRQDWPGKKEEFYTGNHGAISFARDAGYDLVMVGMVEGFRSLDSITIDTKIIETESGITLWFGRTTASSSRRELNHMGDSFWMDTYKPANLPWAAISEKVVRCTVHDLGKDRIMPQ